MEVHLHALQPVLAMSVATITAIALLTGSYDTACCHL